MLRLSLLLEALRRGHGLLVREIPRPPLIVHRVIVLGLYGEKYATEELVHGTDSSRNGSLAAGAPCDSMAIHHQGKRSHDRPRLPDLRECDRETQSVRFLGKGLDGAPSNASPSEQATSLQGDHPERSASIQG